MTKDPPSSSCVTLTCDNSCIKTRDSQARGHHGPPRLVPRDDNGPVTKDPFQQIASPGTRRHPDTTSQKMPGTALDSATRPGHGRQGAPLRGHCPQGRIQESGTPRWSGATFHHRFNMRAQFMVTFGTSIVPVTHASNQGETGIFRCKFGVLRCTFVHKSSSICAN